MSVHLVIPDPHDDPLRNKDRFDDLGRLVVSVRPDHVICLGDWSDMSSLCSYDRGTKGFEGRRYKLDCDSSHEALERFFGPIRRAKRKLPKLWMLHGNHEHRINRAVNVNAAQLDGVISTDDLGFTDYGFEEVPYNGSTPGVLTLDGVHYAHYFTTGIMGKPLGGEHPAYQMIAKQHASCTQGHTHTTDYCVRHSANGSTIHGLVAGCFLDYHADWAGLANDLWWRGVVIKRDVEDGMYDPEWMSIEAVRNV